MSDSERPDAAPRSPKSPRQNAARFLDLWEETLCRHAQGTCPPAVGTTPTDLPAATQ